MLPQRGNVRQNGWQAGGYWRRWRQVEIGNLIWTKSDVLHLRDHAVSNRHSSERSLDAHRHSPGYDPSNLAFQGVAKLMVEGDDTARANGVRGNWSRIGL